MPPSVTRLFREEVRCQGVYWASGMVQLAGITSQYQGVDKEAARLGELPAKACSSREKGSWREL